MTGLEKMKSQILDEAKATANSKIQEAENQAKEILETASQEAAKVADSISQKSAAEIANYKERVESSIDLKKRTEILKAKQEVIAQVLEKAYKAVCEMDTQSYFALLEKMLDKYALAQDGEIYLSVVDRERMPADFVSKIEAAAKAKGGSLKLGEVDKKVTDGFILVYGGVEENCTLKAMFDAKKDELSDCVYQLLFL